jgi:hypothetical protein
LPATAAALLSLALILSACGSGGASESESAREAAAGTATTGAEEAPEAAAAAQAKRQKEKREAASIAEAHQVEARVRKAEEGGGASRKPAGGHKPARRQSKVKSGTAPKQTKRTDGSGKGSRAPGKPETPQEAQARKKLEQEEAAEAKSG